MNLTYQQTIKQLLAMKSPPSYGEILKEIVKLDKESNLKKRMQKSWNYFHGNNDILYSKTEKDDVKGSITEQYWRENIKSRHDYYSMLVKEKADFLCGRPVSYSSENESLKNLFDEYSSTIDSDLYSTAILSINFNKVFWQIYVNEIGELKYMILDTRMCIPIYLQDGKTLNAMIKYYEIEIDGQSRLKIEYWTQEGYSEFIETDDGMFMQGEYTENIDLSEGEIIDKRQVNSHFQGKKNNQTINEYNWSKLPFIEFSYDQYNTFFLDKIKTHIDNIDILSTDGVVDMKTFKEVFASVTGFDSQFSPDSDDSSDTAVRTFWEYLRKYRLMLNRDNDAKAEMMTVPIPIEARKFFLDYFENNIYKFGSSPKRLLQQNISNLSGTALRTLQQPLVLSVSEMNLSFKDGLKKYVEFIKEFKNILTSNNSTDGEIEFKFNLNFLTNDFETIQGLTMSTTMLSQRTILENHPYVEDVDEELKRLEEEANSSLMFAENNPDIENVETEQ